MLSSTPNYLKCYKCKCSPQQFTFLLCNHIVCGNCISKIIETNQRYNFIKCSCEKITYFNDDNQIIENFNQVYENSISIGKPKEDKSTILNDSRQQQNQRNSSTTIGTNVVINPKKKLLVQRISSPLINVSQVFSIPSSKAIQSSYMSPKRHRGLYQKSQMLTKVSTNRKEQSLLLGESNYLKEKHLDNMGNNFIQQFSTHQLEGRNYFQNLEQKENQEKNNQFGYQKSKITNKAHWMFKSQIDFLQIMFKKDVQEIQYNFLKFIDAFKTQFNIFVQQLKSLYVEKVLGEKIIDKINLPSLIKNKYQLQIGEKLKLIRDQLFSVNVNRPLNFFDKIISKQQYQTPDTSIYEQESTKLKKQTQQNNLSLTKFQTIQQKLQRLTRKQVKKQLKNSDKTSRQTYDSSKRIKTQNIHTSIYNNRYQDIYERPTKHLINYRQPEQLSSISQKVNRKRNSLNNCQSQYHTKQRQTCFSPTIVDRPTCLSPTIAYCQKHYLQRQKQTPNSLSYIEKLCHEKKMKNTRDLFKKVKQNTSFQFMHSNKPKYS